LPANPARTEKRPLARAHAACGLVPAEADNCLQPNDFVVPAPNRIGARFKLSPPHGANRPVKGERKHKAEKRAPKATRPINPAE